MVHDHYVSATADKEVTMDWSSGSVDGKVSTLDVSSPTTEEHHLQLESFTAETMEHDNSLDMDWTTNADIDKAPDKTKVAAECQKRQKLHISFVKKPRTSTLHDYYGSKKC